MAEKAPIKKAACYMMSLLTNSFLIGTIIIMTPLSTFQCLKSQLIRFALLLVCTISAAVTNALAMKYFDLKYPSTKTINATINIEKKKIRHLEDLIGLCLIIEAQGVGSADAEVRAYCHRYGYDYHTLATHPTKDWAKVLLHQAFREMEKR